MNGPQKEDFNLSSHIENYFPKLNNSNFQITSPATISYNCIAWAFEDDSNWWWPDKNNQYYWPVNIRREETIDAFFDAFHSIGFIRCDNLNLENGFTKVAVFVDKNNIPKHAARQLTNGKWTSKLGGLHDIEHDLLDLSGYNSREYGSIALIMKKELA